MSPAVVTAAAVAGLVIVLPPGERRGVRGRLLRLGGGGGQSVRARGAARLAGFALLPAAGALLGAPWPPLVAAALAGPVLPVVLARRRQGRLARARRSECVEVVTALAAELRAGRPSGSALGAVADAARHLREPLAVAAAAVANGAAAGPELERVAALPGCAAFRSVAAAWTVTERLGGPVADVLERVGAGLDDERSHRAALDAALAGPRTTMTMLAFLPALGVLLGASTGADPLGLLLHRPLGWGLCAGAAVLDTAGVLWVRRIARSATR